MKRLLILLMIGCFGSSFAQDPGMYVPYYQFRYLTGGQLFRFNVSTFSDVEQLTNKDVYMSFVGGQKAAGLVAIYGTSAYSHDSINDIYYSVYEYDTLGLSRPVNHLYKNDGAWLYTIREPIKKTDKEAKGVADLLKIYTTGEATEEPAFYSIDRGTGENYYMLDIRADILPNYESTERTEYEEFALRIITDHNFKVIQEYKLLGNSTELRELHLMSPVFWK